MIIGINEKQEVVLSFDGIAENAVEANGKTTFKVERKPRAEDGKILCFNPETKTFYYKDRPPVDEEAVKARQARLAERRAAEHRKANALKWLADNDWKVNKRFLGEWTQNDPRWIAYLSDRKQARADIDDANWVLSETK
jgi:hypothetical protein